MASFRVFGNKCRALMAPAKSAAASTSTSTSTSTFSSTPKATKTTTATKAKSGNAGILKVQNVSPALAKFIGSSEASRSGAVKKIWEYVKSHNLQNPDNKREIYCDDTLKTIFDGKDKVDFPGIAKLLSNHFPKSA
ncbi:upstream activation factor subunit spp27-like [Olea europaea var. sylvestris]|uniref:upstream activation factor subunit spp27-like n=1 Tax=Olea europaea var. sylvestris TaxID=158386 RepID=UPI000C1D2EE8|nr:upstream activation factor subunit spp27-like [Olea europaea var. sylvestris]